MARLSGHTIRWATVIPILIGCKGCSGQEGAGATPDPATRYGLKCIWLACSNYQSSNSGKAATKPEDLTPFLRPGPVFPETAKARDEELFRAWQDGSYGVVWGQKVDSDTPKGTDIVVAYETRAKGKGGFLIFGDFRIEWMNPAQLEKAITGRAKAAE